MAKQNYVIGLCHYVLCGKTTSLKTHMTVLHFTDTLMFVHTGLHKNDSDVGP